MAKPVRCNLVNQVLRITFPIYRAEYAALQSIRAAIEKHGGKYGVSPESYVFKPNIARFKNGSFTGERTALFLKKQERTSSVLEVPHTELRYFFTSVLIVTPWSLYEKDSNKIVRHVLKEPLALIIEKEFNRVKAGWKTFYALRDAYIEKEMAV